MPDGTAPEGSTQRGRLGMHFLLANKTAWPILRRAVQEGWEGQAVGLPRRVGG